MNKIFDSHAHYNNERFLQNFNDVMKHLKNNNVGYVLNCAWDLESSILALEQSESTDFMYASAGFHPSEADSATSDRLAKVKSLAENNSKIVAIGEAGLDYYYDDAPSQKEQKETFIAQIKIANDLDLPLIIHTRDAMKDTLDILNEHPVKSGVVHCYSGSAESCKELVKMGFYIGFTGVITFKNAKRAIESLKVVPLDRLLIETDCPYMAPEPMRGKTSDSSMLIYIAQKIGEILEISTEEVIRITTENAKRLYKIEN